MPPPIPDLATIPYLRTVKSYVLRAGRSTAGQTRAMEQLGPKFLLPYQAATTDVRAQWPEPQAPLVLEIGFGMGEASAQIARTLPDTHFLC